MKNPIILLQHNSDKPLGTTVKYTISESGLEINAEIVNNIENTFDLIRNGVLKGFSIGYIPTKWEYVLQD
jgi:phage head maturation protease